MNFLARLDDLTVLRISGEDAADFLHNQLSNDINGMGADDARLAAYCNPKGRMLASLVVWRETTAAGSPLLALAKADVVEPLIKRLRMFVLRAKANFEVTTLKAYGESLTAPSAATRTTVEASAAAAGDHVSEAALRPAPGASWQVQRDGSLTRISAPVAAGGLQRWWLIAQEDSDIAALASQLGLPSRETSDAWQKQDIEAGLGWVEQANVEMFIPQSLNYDLIGGVSFTKGCYPGQEVVARAHFRGAVKRRGMPGHCQAEANTSLHAGMDIFDARRPRSPAGRIVSAAPAADPQGIVWHLFMEISLADIGQADFRALSPDGPAIHLLPPPYPLESDE